ncbi:hypothetical protein SAMN05421810_11070 [Amycolatopsis arida]|uniref:Uncharacterized protein n=1 Tax=Amycolatopsis arida TaxID=587909 RepID=A0A1I5ZR24_9PSEU|nr:hypothetical protein CLV69_11070 [Amycolatopsis arida]SFQ58926.1 hypothetical protein SAMN05421810_11070 [Amycolatopsis arida]
MRGVVQDGVEPGCLILATGTEQYLLLGAGGAMAKPGAEVVVTGRVEPDTLTTCQQGVPLAVTDVRPT